MSKQVICRDVAIGGGAPVSIQSMTNVDSRNEKGVLEQIARLKDAGCQLTDHGSYETFDEPGTHLCLSYSRPCPQGGIETRSREWIGWKPVNGKLVRDPATKCDEAYLRKVVIHTLVEWEHLYTFLPELYAEYKGLPADAD